MNEHSLARDSHSTLQVYLIVPELNCNVLYHVYVQYLENVENNVRASISTEFEVEAIVSLSKPKRIEAQTSHNCSVAETMHSIVVNRGLFKQDFNRG